MPVSSTISAVQPLTGREVLVARGLHQLDHDPRRDVAEARDQAVGAQQQARHRGVLVPLQDAERGRASFSVSSDWKYGRSPHESLTPRMRGSAASACTASRASGVCVHCGML